MNPIDILLLTCNRGHLSKRTIDGIIERTRTPYRLIVIDNNSTDDTVDILKKFDSENKIHKLILLDKEHTVNIAGAYNIGLEYVESEYFMTMQDDVIVPDVEPDWIQQLIALMEKNPGHGGIGCRIQRIPNMKWLDGDLTPARRSLSAYARIQKKSDIDKLQDGFGLRDWDDLAFVSQVRGKLKKECSWANNLWCNHIGHAVENRGYPDGYKRMWGWDKNRVLDFTHKPYPQIDPKTNKPLPGEKIYR